MKIMLGSRGHHYLARVSIFLVMVALIAGMVGCSDGPYNLTITSTDGGAVTAPGEGTRTFYSGELVSLVATPEAGYQFVRWSGDVSNINDEDDPTTTILMQDDYEITANFASYVPMVAAGGWHTVGVESDGTVVAVGSNSDGQLDVGGWTNIDQVAAGEYHTVGCKSNNTVVAVGLNISGQCDVGGWTNIVQVAAGGNHTVGRKSNNTVVAVGLNISGQCDVGGWTNIVQVDAGFKHTVGLRSN